MDLVHYHFETIHSTNTWAKESAEQFAIDKLTLVTASTQTSGRGRFKRKWHSPSGVNIYATYCFFIDYGTINVGFVPQLLALSAVQVLEELSIFPKLKWPNDLLLNGKKMAGILCETVSVLNRCCIVCGIGLNVNMSIEDIQKIDIPATSLLFETGKEYEIGFLLKLLTEKFSRQLDYFLKNGFGPYFQEYRERLVYSRGDLVAFHDNQRRIQGQFYSYNEDGSVTLQFEDKTLKTFLTGEFLLLF